MNQKKYKLSVGPQGVFQLLLPIICTIVVLSFSRPGWYNDSAAWTGISIPVLSYLSLVVLLLTLSSVKVFDRCVVGAKYADGRTVIWDLDGNVISEK